MSIYTHTHREYCMLSSEWEFDELYYVCKRRDENMIKFYCFAPFEHTLIVSAKKETVKLPVVLKTSVNSS